jgi:DNA primase
LKKYSKEELIKSVRIVEVADKLGIPLEDVQTGNFTHRCRCPSPKHNERTGSLFIDSINNNFYCFGCCASNNVIDFYILAATSDFIGAINYLSELVDPNKIVVADSEKKETNFNDLLKISIGFKKILRKYPEDFDWITSIMEKTDRYVESIDRHDVERVKILQKKLGETFKRRFDKKCGQ